MEGHLDHLDLLRGELDAFVAAIECGPLTAPIAACPGWDLAHLGGHIAFVHRWATESVLTAASPPRENIAPVPAPGALVQWVRDGGEALIAALSQVPVDAPTWHPFPAPRTAGVWRRRQLHELTVHRWDAQDAIGAAAIIDPVIASDGVDEYLSMMLPRRIIRDGGDLPQSSLHVHCTDTPGEWLVWSTGNELQVRREPAKGDAALRGTAEALLLSLWGRRHRSPIIDVVGDPVVAEAWLALGG
ncbi:MAG TPA: maleylpyruvate isomerase family mycothiol-dependent enzyme [Acidimicrobiales bacterium]|nr:maleylpyruvate isomerase family mycothiol-dependent enzyme [Acidimicrobiales bacterium]